MAKVKIMETVLRDAHQSLMATRMTTEEMLPIIDKMDRVGYHSLEAWGGATFDACLRFLNEDPWERLRKIKAVAKNTKIQMLTRGQNILGYRHYSDDVVHYFVQKAIANGVNIIRVFDALNDIRNFQSTIDAGKKEGGHIQASISYTISPVHSTDSFVQLAKQLEERGADSICIKDMAGLLLPMVAHELISKLKQSVKIPVQLHTHYTSGVASMTYIKAVEAGVDIIDTAISPFAMGTSQPPTEAMVAALKGTEFDTGLDLSLLGEIAEYFKPLREKYIKEGLIDPKVMGTDVQALLYQVPGGMLSNLIKQLKEQGEEGDFDKVLEEIPKVRQDLGYPPLVTPTSQIVGSQAVLNVIAGERYKMISKETKALVKGEYGKTPAEISFEVMQKIIGDDEPITCRPADLLKPELENHRKDIEDTMIQDEDVLSYALFDHVALDFFKKRASKARRFNVEVDGTVYEVDVIEGDPTVSNVTDVFVHNAVDNGAKSEPAPNSQTTGAEAPAGSAKASGKGRAVNSPMPGNIIAVKVSVGDVVKVGNVLCVLEAMKMENEILAPCDGKITAINCTEGTPVHTGDTLIVIG